MEKNITSGSEVAVPASRLPAPARLESEDGERPGTERGFAIAGCPRAGHIWKNVCIHTQTHSSRTNKSRTRPPAEQTAGGDAAAAGPGGAGCGRPGRGALPAAVCGWGGGGRAAAGAAFPSATTRVGGLSRPDGTVAKKPGGEAHRRRFAKRDGEPGSSAASPAGEPGARQPRAAGTPGPLCSRPGVASQPRRLRPAALRLSPPPADPVPPSPPPAAAARSSGGGGGKRGWAGRDGTGRDRVECVPRTPPASGRALGYLCSVTVCRYWCCMWSPNHPVLRENRHRVRLLPSFLAA